MSRVGSSWVRWCWQLLKVSLVLAAVAAVVYLLKFSPVRVREHTVERGEIVAEVLGTGTLEARVRVTISPKISGRIEEILVDEGDRVTADDVLVRLDNDELVQQVEIAQAALSASRAAVERLRTDKGRAVAVAAQARKQYERNQQLIDRSAVSESEFDKAVESLAVADAEIASAEAAIVEGQQNELAAEKTLAYHGARLADTQIAAPFDGLIVARQRDPGDVVVPGSPILQLISLDQLWISAWIDETQMAQVRVGQPARVVFRSEPDRSYPGEVVRLGKEADRETREFIVDVLVLELPQNWAVGQRAEVYIETARKQDVTLLNATQVSWQNGAAGVFVSRDQRAVWQPLQLGLRSLTTLEVVEGLRVGDVVVEPRDPRGKLTPGKRIVAK